MASSFMQERKPSWVEAWSRHRFRASKSGGLSANRIFVLETGSLGKTTVTNDNKQRRPVEFKDGCRYGKFGKTRAYELIAQERIRTYRMGGKTLIDLDSIDEYHASLPRVESRAML